MIFKDFPLNIGYGLPMYKTEPESRFLRNRISNRNQCVQIRHPIFTLPSLKRGQFE